MPFFSLEFVSGGSLDKKIDKKPQHDPLVYFHVACFAALGAGAVAELPDHYEKRDWPAGTPTRPSSASTSRRLGGGRASTPCMIPDLDPIRGDPGFAVVLEEFRKASAST